MRDQREYVLEFGKNFGILCGLKLCVTRRIKFKVID